MTRVRAFVQARVCLRGKQVEQSLYVDTDTGLLVEESKGPVSERVDLKGCFLAPALLELQINGAIGFHFTKFVDVRSYQENLYRISKHLLKSGVGAFYVTLPTVSSHVLEKVLPLLEPREFVEGADLLGAHCEGPCLNAMRKGAHDATLLQTPSQAKEGKVYGHPEPSCLKLVTLAPELEGSVELISTLTNDHDIQVSLGHSAADFDTGIAAMRAGARSLTHVFNAMSPLHHRNPGLGGLIASPDAPYFSLIADGVHLHPTIVTMAFRSNPTRCILITDALEMAGMPDGVYPGHAQIPHPQRKQGNKVVIDNTDTLVGSCVSMEDCVRNLKQWAGCSVPEAVRCATENIVNLMNLKDRGILEIGRRADFAVLDETGKVMQTWIKGEKVYER